MWVSTAVSALTVAPFPLPTRFSKSTLVVLETPFPPITVPAEERSSNLWESRRNWSCSFSTRSPSFLITSINLWNCCTFSTLSKHQVFVEMPALITYTDPLTLTTIAGGQGLQLLLDQLWIPWLLGQRVWPSVASQYWSSRRKRRRTITAGSFVRILDKSGTSFWVKLV